MNPIDRKCIVVDVNIPRGPHAGRIRIEIDVDEATEQHYEGAAELARLAVDRLVKAATPPGAPTDAR